MHFAQTFESYFAYVSSYKNDERIIMYVLSMTPEAHKKNHQMMATFAMLVRKARRVGSRAIGILLFNV